MAQNRHEEAIVQAERSLALNPSFMEAYEVLCLANNFLGRPDRTSRRAINLAAYQAIASTIPSRASN